MSLHVFPHLLRRLKKDTPLLGLDVGTRAIGIAVSDPARGQAAPLSTLRRKSVPADMAALAEIARARDARGFILGLPLNMDGGEGKMAAYVRAFAGQMLAHKKLFAGEPEISFFDERLSSAAVERFLIKSGVSRKRRREVVDKLAAQAILQAALDCIARTGTTSSEKK